MTATARHPVRRQRSARADRGSATRARTVPCVRASTRHSDGAPRGSDPPHGSPRHRPGGSRGRPLHPLQPFHPPSPLPRTGGATPTIRWAPMSSSTSSRRSPPRPTVPAPWCSGSNRTRRAWISTAPRSPTTNVRSRPGCSRMRAEPGVDRGGRRLLGAGTTPRQRSGRRPSPRARWSWTGGAGSPRRLRVEDLPVEPRRRTADRSAGSPSMRCTACSACRRPASRHTLRCCRSALWCELLLCAWRAGCHHDWADAVALHPGRPGRGRRDDAVARGAGHDRGRHHRRHPVDASVETVAEATMRAEEELDWARMHRRACAGHGAPDLSIAEVEVDGPHAVRPMAPGVVPRPRADRRGAAGERRGASRRGSARRCATRCSPNSVGERRSTTG